MGYGIAHDESNRLVEATLFSRGEELSNYLVLTCNAIGKAILYKARAGGWYFILIEEDELATRCVQYLMERGGQTQEEDKFFDKNDEPGK